MWLAALILCWPLLSSPATAPTPAAIPPAAWRDEQALPALPALAAFAATPAICGSEAAFLQEVAALLPQGWRAETDSFGSLIVRRGDPAAAVSRVLAVGVDEPGYVVSQIREDGWLRLRTVGRTMPAAFHAAREGRPVSVLTRRGPVSGVIAVNSVHLRAPRPEALGEEHLYLDVGADAPDDVAALGIELLDAVAMREVVTLADGSVSGPSLGARAAAFALLAVLRELPPAAGGAAGDGAGDGAEQTAFAFVAQSLPGTGPLGRGGEGLVRRLAPQHVILLRTSGGAEQPAAAAAALEGGPAGWSVLQLRVSHAGSAVETVAASDLSSFRTALAALAAEPSP